MINRPDPPRHHRCAGAADLQPDRRLSSPWCTCCCRSWCCRSTRRCGRSRRACAPRLARRGAVDGLRAGLPAADDARDRRRLPARLHPGARLLHHAGPGRRRRRPDGRLLHRLLHDRDRELGHGRRARRAAARRDDALYPVYAASSADQVRLGYARTPARSATLLAQRPARFCALVLAFLVLPILAVVPLSVNSGRILYPLEGFSWRWYDELFFGSSWSLAIWNSLVIGVSPPWSRPCSARWRRSASHGDFRGQGLLLATRRRRR